VKLSSVCWFVRETLVRNFIVRMFVVRLFVVRLIIVRLFDVRLIIVRLFVVRYHRNNYFFLPLNFELVRLFFCPFHPCPLVLCPFNTVLLVRLTTLVQH